MNVESEIISHEGTTSVEPELSPEGGDYKPATTKTWRLLGKEGNFWKIKVLSYHLESLDTLVFGPGNP
jgi:hypothetical protein